MMIRARRDRLDAEREWDLAKLGASSLGFAPNALDRTPTSAGVPHGRKFSVKSSGTIEYYD